IVLSTVLVLSAAAIFSFWQGGRGKSSDSSVVWRRSFPNYVVARSQFATVMVGVELVAHIGIGYDAGWRAITYSLRYSRGVVILLLLANCLKEQNFSTMPEIFKKLYGTNKVMMSIVTFLAIIVPFGWLCTQLVAFGNLFSEITGITFTVLIIIFAAISLIFVL